MKEVVKAKISRVVWYFKQLLPLTYRSTYTQDGERHFTVWNMWMGRCFNVDDFIIKAESINNRTTE